MKEKMREQWFAGVIQQHDYDKGVRTYRNVCMWDNDRKPGNRYYPTREAAQKALDHAYWLWNRVHVYNSKGERYETTEAAPGIGVSLVCTPETDGWMRIVKHIIQKRYVTEWDTVEEE